MNTVSVIALTLLKICTIMERMKGKRIAEICLNAVTACVLVLALALTFTVSDYYIFNRFGQFNAFFILAQWGKKAGLLLLPLAVYYRKRSCSDLVKYTLPVFAVISCFTYGGFFDVTAVTAESAPAQLVYAGINEFMPKAANMALFFTQNALMIVACAFLFVRDGFRLRAKSLPYFPLAAVACMPLNIFENFFEIENFPEGDFLRFGNFTVWHLLAVAVLILFTVGSYYFLRNKDRRLQNDWLVAAAIVLLIQYHSKDSMVMGDGYNVYHTVFACIPLFICNIGVYVASASVVFRKKWLYAISFFIHAAGAVSVFVYFGKAEMSNYGIFCSYSILYFCLTHCLLFALSVLPAALGHYRFRMKDCLVPLGYYFAVIVAASVASALVTSASMDFSRSGYTLAEGEWLLPNYAFTQINPLPFEVPVWKLTVWKYDLNVLYVLGLYAAYVAIFYAFNGLYYAFLAVRKRLPSRRAQKPAEDAETSFAKTEEESPPEGEDKPAA